MPKTSLPHCGSQAQRLPGAWRRCVWAKDFMAEKFCQVQATVPQQGDQRSGELNQSLASSADPRNE